MRMFARFAAAAALALLSINAAYAAQPLPRLSEKLRTYDYVAQTPIYVAVYGPSTVDVPDSNGKTMAENIFTAIERTYNQGTNKFYNFQLEDQSVSGTIAYQWPSAWSATPNKPDVCVFMYVPNDAQTAGYNAGATYPFFVDSMINAIATCRAAGADSIVVTSHHIRKMSTANVVIPVSMPSTIPQNYPCCTSAPVSGSALVPADTVSASCGDFLQNGSSLCWDVRFRHVNQGLENIALSMGAMVINGERAIETLLWTRTQAHSGNQHQGEDDIFGTDQGNIIHLEPVGQDAYREAFFAAFDAYAAAPANDNANSEPYFVGKTTSISDEERAVCGTYSNVTSPGPFLISTPSGSGQIDLEASQSGIGKSYHIVDFFNDGTTLKIRDGGPPAVGTDPVISITAGTFPNIAVTLWGTSVPNFYLSWGCARKNKF